jgi:hypothetical protein
MTRTVFSAIHDAQRREILARQGLRLPPIVLGQLRRAGIYCQPTISIERQQQAKQWVLRGVESGGGVAEIGAYSSFVTVDGNALSWLQRVDSATVNGVHAVAIAPSLVRLEMIRIGRSYDLFITRHSLSHIEGRQKPRLESAVVFHGRRGTLEMELWGRDAPFRGEVCPVFYSRSGEILTIPFPFEWPLGNLTAAVCCIGCRHCHVLEPCLLKH